MGRPKLVRERIRDHGRAMERAAFALDGLGRRVVFSPDFAEDESQHDREHHADQLKDLSADLMIAAARVQPDQAIDENACAGCEGRTQNHNQDCRRIAHALRG